MTVINSDIFPIHRELDVARTVLEASKLAKKIGFSASEQHSIATVVSELGKNIIRYGETGRIILSKIEQNHAVGIEVIAEDEGPGIDDIEKVMTEHYTTTQGSLGLGLKAVKRIMDELEIKNKDDKGILVTTRKWLSHGKN